VTQFEQQGCLLAENLDQLQAAPFILTHLKYLTLIFKDQGIPLHPAAEKEPSLGL
jgi:hypothetical protein